MKRKLLVGSVTIFVLLMLGLMIGMYLTGFSSPMISYASTSLSGTNGGKVSSFDVGTFISGLKEAIMSPLGIAVILMIGLSSFISAITAGFGGGQTTSFLAASVVTYLIPIIILFAVANVFFFPIIPSATAGGLPYPLSFILTMVFNVLLLLAIVSWATGRD